MRPLTEADLRRLARLPLPLPPRSASPWPDTPSRGRHYEPLNKAHLPDVLSAKLVGLTFSPRYPSNVDGVEADLAAHTGWAMLVREPDNPYDPNAVRVDWVSGDGERIELGHVPAGLAARLAADIDAGAVWTIRSTEVLRVGGRGASHPGCSVSLIRARAPESG